MRLGFVIDPKFSDVTRVHDWRNHVPKDIKEMWYGLSFETKVIVYRMASEMADQEEWD